MQGVKTQTWIAAVCLLSLSACDKYLDRRDQVTFGNGDSIAANKALQIIDPWPQSARTIEQGSSGEQAAAAIEKLRRRTAAPEGAGNASSQPLTTSQNPPKF